MRHTVPQGWKDGFGMFCFDLNHMMDIIREYLLEGIWYFVAVQIKVRSSSLTNGSSTMESVQAHAAVGHPTVGYVAFFSDIRTSWHPIISPHLRNIPSGLEALRCYLGTQNSWQTAARRLHLG